MFTFRNTFYIFLITFVSTIYGQNINVLDFGAKGDGVQDDTKFIQNSLDLAEKKGGATVLIPTAKSDYKISETLFIGSNTKIVFEKSFLKLSHYTSIGTILANKRGATNIKIINPKIDGNNISSGGTGENGISFGDGGICYVEGGIIRNCKSGTISNRLGGKGFQVEDKNVKLFSAKGTKIINCTFALSSQFDINGNKELGTNINVIYDNITAENCDSFLLLQQVNGINESLTKHNVTISNFNVINCGIDEGIFIFSRAKGANIINGLIIGSLEVESIFRGRHSDINFKNITIKQRAQNILDLRPSFHGNAFSKSENNIYNFNLFADFNYLLFSSDNDEYSYRELFNSTINIKSNKKYSKNTILPQAIFKTSKLSYVYINNKNQVINKVQGGLFDLLNK